MKLKYLTVTLTREDARGFEFESTIYIEPDCGWSQSGVGTEDAWESAPLAEALAKAAYEFFSEDQDDAIESIADSVD